MTLTLEEEVLELICSGRATYQNDIWKRLGIDSRKCSRVLINLEKNGLIRRESEVVNGVRTYRVIYNKFWPLMAGDMIAPCCGCTDECQPEYCALLDEWIQALLCIKKAIGYNKYE
ncbi:MAG: hypothetical protein LRZ87_03195 [Methanocellales archaeon]|nr:hypothetical protein [Methanocellales archaeon]